MKIDREPRVYREKPRGKETEQRDERENSGQERKQGPLGSNTLRGKNVISHPTFNLYNIIHTYIYISIYPFNEI